MEQTYYVTGLYADNRDGGLYVIPSQNALEARYRAIYRSTVERGWEGMMRPVTTLCDGKSVGQPKDYKFFHAPRASNLLQMALQAYRGVGDREDPEAEALERLVFALSEVPALDVRLQHLKDDGRVSFFAIPDTDLEVLPSEGLTRFSELISSSVQVSNMLKSFAYEYGPILDALPGNYMGGRWHAADTRQAG